MKKTIIALALLGVTSTSQAAFRSHDWTDDMTGTKSLFSNDIYKDW
ncbi:hypothetical protein [Photobacterium kishitanii]|nr:hypothetical protein [Photobacterium kishitanii]